MKKLLPIALAAVVALNSLTALAADTGSNTPANPTASQQVKKVDNTSAAKTHHKVSKSSKPHVKKVKKHHKKTSKTTKKVGATKKGETTKKVEVTKKTEATKKADATKKVEQGTAS